MALWNTGFHSPNIDNNDAAFLRSPHKDIPFFGLGASSEEIRFHWIDSRYRAIQHRLLLPWLVAGDSS